jgi:hypothetical protein
MAGWASSRRPAPPSIIATPRIAPIYEGTNGIQAADLVGRKIGLEGGDVLARLLAEMRTQSGTRRPWLR